MTAEVREETNQIRDVNVRWAHVIVEGHTVEQVLSFDVAEADSVYGRPFDDEMDIHIQMGMFAIDRIALSETMGKVASATSYVLDGKCMRTAKIVHCKDIEPASMRPVLEQPPVLPESLVQMFTVIPSEPAPENQILGALHSPDWVDLNTS